MSKHMTDRYRRLAYVQVELDEARIAVRVARTPLQKADADMRLRLAQREARQLIDEEKAWLNAKGGAT